MISANPRIGGDPSERDRPTVSYLEARLDRLSRTNGDPIGSPPQKLPGPPLLDNGRVLLSCSMCQGLEDHALCCPTRTTRTHNGESLVLIILFQRWRKARNTKQLRHAKFTVNVACCSFMDEV